MSAWRSICARNGLCGHCSPGAAVGYVCSESLSLLRIELEDDEPVGMKMWSRPGEEGSGGGSSRKIRAASQSIGRPPSGSGLMVCSYVQFGVRGRLPVALLSRSFSSKSRHRAGITYDWFQTWIGE